MLCLYFYTTELNFEQKSLKSNLLTSTANVLRYMNGIKNLSPKFIATNDYFTTEKMSLSILVRLKLFQERIKI